MKSWNFNYIREIAFEIRQSLEDFDTIIYRPELKNTHKLKQSNYRDLTIYEKILHLDTQIIHFKQLKRNHQYLEIEFDLNSMQVLSQLLIEIRKNLDIEIFLYPLSDINIQKNHSQLKTVLDEIGMYSHLPMRIYFSQRLMNHEQWDSIVLNPFKGPRILHFDFSNFCNHNCHFCGLYSDFAKEKVEKNLNDEAKKKLYHSKLSNSDFETIISTMGFSVKRVQIGGMGEPLSHPQFESYYSRLCYSNIKELEIFSHFAYNLPAEQLHRLHNACVQSKTNVELIINLSAATAATYHKIRPNQDPEVFYKVIENCSILNNLRRKEGAGINVTYLHIMNHDNYHELPMGVMQAHLHNFTTFWAKPVEIHGQDFENIKITTEDFPHLICSIFVMLTLGNILNLTVKDEAIHWEMIQQNHKIFVDIIKDKSFSKFLNSLFKKSPELMEYLLEIDWTKILNEKLKNNFNNNLMKIDFDSITFSAQYYSEFPCYIGHEFLRLSVDRKSWPCCISEYPLATKDSLNVDEIIFSKAMMNFRHKVLTINQEKFHLNTDEWKFCKQCPHIRTNQFYHHNRESALKTNLSMWRI